MTQSFDVNVTFNYENGAPQIVSQPVTAAIPGIPYEYQIIATDPDALDILSYSFVSSPNRRFKLDSSTGLLTFNAAGVYGTAHTISVRVTDGLLSDEQTFVVASPQHYR